MKPSQMSFDKQFIMGILSQCHRRSSKLLDIKWSSKSYALSGTTNFTIRRDGSGTKLIKKKSVVAATWRPSIITKHVININLCKFFVQLYTAEHYRLYNRGIDHKYYADENRSTFKLIGSKS